MFNEKRRGRRAENKPSFKFTSSSYCQSDTYFVEIYEFWYFNFLKYATGNKNYAHRYCNRR